MSSQDSASGQICHLKSDKNSYEISDELHQQVANLLAQLNTVILGKSTTIKLALAGLLARGHLLIEDLPGMGKTTLAHSLAKSLGLQFNRVQFTSDLLPSDILGGHIYNAHSTQHNEAFEFHPGPIFCQMLLADEINRATPKTQSALLEAMEEQQVSIDGTTRQLPTPFFVVATQNPSSQFGTYPLPESQLDRFTMRLEMGYPNAEEELTLLAGTSRREALNDIAAVLSIEDLTRLQKSVVHIKASDNVLRYVRKLLEHTRQHQQFAVGLSPRAGVTLVNVARAWALLDKRNYVIPEDIQAVFTAVAGHRLLGNSSLERIHVVKSVLETVSVLD